MPATDSERLDELLAMARELGRLDAEVTDMEHRANYGPRSFRGRTGRALLRTAQSKRDAAQTLLDRTRESFVADVLDDAGRAWSEAIAEAASLVSTCIIDYPNRYGERLDALADEIRALKRDS